MRPKSRCQPGWMLVWRFSGRFHFQVYPYHWENSDPCGYRTKVTTAWVPIIQEPISAPGDELHPQNMAPPPSGQQGSIKSFLGFSSVISSFSFSELKYLLKCYDTHSNSSYQHHPISLLNVKLLLCQKGRQIWSGCSTLSSRNGSVHDTKGQ